MGISKSGKFVGTVMAAFMASSFSLGPGLCEVAVAAETGSASKRYQAPVNAPIVRPYEAPSGPYASGHRGIDYGTPAGSVVVASNGGTVKFAGPVASSGLFITISHSDGLETLYSFLSELNVSQGDVVAKGQLIGLSGGGHPGEAAALHFAVKQNGKYIDPALVLSGESDDVSELLSLAPVEGGVAPGEGGADPGFGQAPFTADEFNQPSNGSPVFLPPPPGTGSPTGLGPFGGVGSPNGLGSPNGIFPAPGFADPDSFSADSLGAEGQGSSKKVEDRTQTQPKPRKGVFVREAEKMQRNVIEFGKAMKKGAQMFWSAPKRVARGAKSLWARYKAWAIPTFERAAEQIGPNGGETPAFKVMRGLLKGAFAGTACKLKGGTPLPELPTSKQLAKGKKAPAAPNDNIVVAVAGLGSSSKEENGKVTSSASMFKTDFRTLGYKAKDIYNFSYKGIEDRGGNDPYRLHKAYAKTDTYKDIRESSRELSRLLREIHRQMPSRKIDLVAHSQGGVVSSYFVSRLYDPGNPIFPKVDHLVTIGSPLQGADASSARELLTNNGVDRLTYPGIDFFMSRVIPMPPSSSTSVGQMSATSDFISDLQGNWDPGKVKTTTIGNSWDPVVAPQNTHLPGESHYTSWLPPTTFFLNHGKNTNIPETKGFVYNALADRRSECTGFKDAFADNISGPLMSATQKGLLRGLDIMTGEVVWS